MAMAIRCFGKLKNLAIRLFWPFVGPESFNFCVGESVGVHPIVASLDHNYLETGKR